MGVPLPETPVKDPITQDIAAAAGRAAPPIVGAVYTSLSSIPWAIMVSIATLIYTLALTFSVVVKNWGEWTAWIAARWMWANRLWERVRGWF